MNELTERQRFFLDGCLKKKFKQTEALSSLVSCLTEINKKNIRSGFSLEQKYQWSLDLRPNVYEYDDCFLDILFENDIHEFFKNTVGHELFLAHVQCRVAYPSSPANDRGYMEWHRDAYYYNHVGKVSGLLPPVYKIIFYPKIYEEEKPTLHFVKGSHLKFDRDQRSDIEGLRSLELETITPSEDEFVFFNVMGTHSTAPVQDTGGQSRVIYSFCLRDQLENYKDESDLHQIYTSRLEK